MAVKSRKTINFVSRGDNCLLFNVFEDRNEEYVIQHISFASFVITNFNN